MLISLAEAVANRSRALTEKSTDSINLEVSVNIDLLRKATARAYPDCSCNQYLMHFIQLLFHRIQLWTAGLVLLSSLFLLIALQILAGAPEHGRTGTWLLYHLDTRLHVHLIEITQAFFLGKNSVRWQHEKHCESEVLGNKC